MVKEKKEIEAEEVKEVVEEKRDVFDLGEVVTGREYVVSMNGKGLTKEQVDVLILRKLDKIERLLE